MKARMWNRASALLVILIVVGLVTASARAAVEDPNDQTLSSRGQPIILYHDPHPPTNLRVPPPPSFFKTDAPRTLLQIHYLAAGAQVGDYTCYEWSNEAKAAFGYAASIWESLIDSAVPIEIDACWTEMAGNALGGSSSNYVYNNVTFTWYPESLANALQGSNVDRGHSDMTIVYNRNFDWYYGTDGNTPLGKVDFVSVVLHEICHGLGFAGSMSKINGLGYWGWAFYNDPVIYDRFAENGSGTALLDLGNGTPTLGAELTGENLYFDGPNANAANGGLPPELYAPDMWASGSSYSHLDYDVFNDTLNELMVWQISSGESVHNPGPITLGMLQDIGWGMSETPSYPVAVYLPLALR